jgi:NADH:ubiquinone oxidoreductase subunit 3 (subunit A)
MTVSFIGISGYIAIVAFLFILILGFIYEVVRGALNPH